MHDPGGHAPTLVFTQAITMSSIALLAVLSLEAYMANCYVFMLLVFRGEKRACVEGLTLKERQKDSKEEYADGGIFFILAPASLSFASSSPALLRLR